MQLKIEQREAEEYNENKVMKNIVDGGTNVIKAHLQHLYEHGQKEYLKQAMDYLKDNNMEIPDYKSEKTYSCACPGAQEQDLSPKQKGQEEPVILSAELRNWPVQLQLLNPNAPYLKNADLLIAADCVPFVYPNFHKRFLKDKILIILCLKLDKTIEMYIDKLAEIFSTQDINSISVVHMEVPCCSGIGAIVQKALEKAQKNIIVKDYTISIKGEIV